MKTFMQSIKSVRSLIGVATLAFVAVVSAPGIASAAPAFFSVDKPTVQRVCYRQYNNGSGWQDIGFKNLDHCLRYVSTPPPADKNACKGGWWFVYGFNNQGQCINWVNQNSGGYDGELAT